MPGVLATHVHIDGSVWGPGDDVPDEVAEQITNPDVWAEPPPERPARRHRTKD